MITTTMTTTTITITTTRTITRALQGHDHNLVSAYLHVLADALTSVLAIVALLAAKYFGLTWMDPFMGHRRRRARRALVFRAAQGDECRAARSQRGAGGLRRRAGGLERVDGNRVVDLHVWCIGLNLYSAALTVVTPLPRPPEHYKALLPPELNIVHATVEVHAAAPQITPFKNRYSCMISRVKPRPPAPIADRSRQRASAAPPRAHEGRSARRRCSAIRLARDRPVSVEELIAEADVSRATFYGLFSSKYSLLDGILNPIFELATRRIRELCAGPPDAGRSTASSRSTGRFGRRIATVCC